MALAQSGQLPEAKKLLEDICRIDRLDSEAWLMLGFVCGQLGNAEGETISALQEAVRLGPESAQAHAARGIGRERVELTGFTETQAAHLDVYRRIDIALDTFPYNGTTTTCEALWMGVPVVTLAGARHSGRVGVSLLNAAGLRDWIAERPEHYVDIATSMAADIPRLTNLRACLRQQMAASPLCDGKAFARKVEAAWREMWRAWCSGAA